MIRRTRNIITAIVLAAAVGTIIYGQHAYGHSGGAMAEALSSYGWGNSNEWLWYLCTIMREAVCYT